MYRKYVKRLLDLFMALFCLIVLSPVILVTATLVWAELGRPVIFKQPRPGLKEKIFLMYKFRTMTDERDEDGSLLPDEKRLTRFGKFLRSTSLDELPELWNILKGDMSFVGPRPQLVKDMVFMTDEQRRRHTVRPGLTGLAQVRGRNSISWDEKLSHDLEYIDNVTIWMDVKVLVMTIAKVMSREGITSHGMDTAEDLGDYLLRIGRISNSDYGAGIARCNALLDAAKRNL